MIKKKIVNIASLFLNSIFGKGFVLIVNILMARYTTTDLYGRFVLIRSAINVAENSFSTTVNSVVMTEAAIEKENHKYNVIPFLISGVIGVLVAIGIIVFLHLNSLINITSSNLSAVFIIPFFVISCFFNNALLSINTGKEVFPPILKSSTISFLITTLIIFFNKNNLNIYTALLFLGIYHCLELCFKLYFNRNLLQPFYSRSNLYIDTLDLLKKSKPLIISGFFNAIVFFIIRYLLSLTDDGYKKLAIFDIYFQAFVILMIIIINLVNLSSTALIKKEIKELSYFCFYKRMSFYILPTTITFSAVIYLLSGYFVNFVNPLLYLKELEFYIPIMAFVFSLSLIQTRSMIVFGFQKTLPKSVFISSLITVFYAYVFVEQPQDLSLSYIIFYISSIILNTIFISFTGGNLGYVVPKNSNN
ncbi:hypothetical protein AADZ86_02775 [Colwelliaceae bacterium BS250]